MKARRRLFRPATLVVVAALLVAACGGGDDDDGSAPEPTGGGTEAVEATGTPIKVGLLCDRSGPTSIIGINLCPGFLDYLELVNTVKGGVDNHPVEAIDYDHAYDATKAKAGYDSMIQQGAVTILCYGTPIAVALDVSVNRDKVPCLTPGFGIAQAGDPTKYPYQFPLAASYYSQAAAAVTYALAHTDAESPKIAYVYYDNPAGKEPLPVLEALADREGFELRTFDIAPPGIDQDAKVADVVENFEADFVITHLFGQAPAESITAFKDAGYPLDQVISLVWGAAEADIETAGGYEYADGYTTVQFAGVGQDYPIIDEIVAMYAARGEDPPDALTGKSVYYNRGVFVAALLVEALKAASEASGDQPITGEAVKAGLETLTEFSADGLAPPLTISPTDHEGGGFTHIYQVANGKLEPVGDWDNPEHDLVLELVAEG